MKAGFERMGYGYTAIVIFAIIFVILGIVIRLTGIYLTIDHEDLGFFAKLAVLLIVFICLFGYVIHKSETGKGNYKIYIPEGSIIENYNPM